MKLLLTVLTLETVSILLGSAVGDLDHLQDQVRRRPASDHHTVAFGKLLQLTALLSFTPGSSPSACSSSSLWTCSLFPRFQEGSISSLTSPMVLAPLGFSSCACPSLCPRQLFTYTSSQPSSFQALIHPFLPICVRGCWRIALLFCSLLSPQFIWSCLISIQQVVWWENKWMRE